MMSTVRRSPPPASAAWPRSKPNASCRPMPSSGRRRSESSPPLNARREKVDMMDWDKLKVFHAAAEAGSFTHAGEVLGLSQSAVSRQVSALEQDLEVPLFHRHARGLILTEQGEVLFRTVQDVMLK